MAVINGSNFPWSYWGPKNAGFYIQNGANYVGGAVAGGSAGNLLVTLASFSNWPRAADGSPDMSIITPAPGWVILKTMVMREGGDPRVIGGFSILFEYLLTPSDYTNKQWHTTVESPVDTRCFRAWAFLINESTSVNGVAVVEETVPAINHYPPAPEGAVAGDRVLQFILPPEYGAAKDHIQTIWDSDTVPSNDIQPETRPWNEFPLSDTSYSGKYWRTYKAGSYNRALVAHPCLLVTCTLSPVAKPLPPVLSAPPKDTWTDLSARGVTVSWKPYNGFAAPQTGWILKCETTYGTLYWNALSANLVTTSTVNSGAVSSVNIPASSFPAATSRNVNHIFSAATVAGGYQSPFSPVKVVLNTAPPLAGATLEGRSPDGQLATLIPQARFSFAPGNPTIAVTAWEAKLLAAGVEVASGEGALTPGQATVLWSSAYQVPNLTTVQVMVRCLQMGGEWSPWAISEEAEANVTVPIAPSVVATPTTHGTSGVPGVHVAISWDGLADPYSWETQSSTGYLARQAPDGSWSLVGTFPLPPGITEASITDYGSELGEVSYRAWATGTAVDGSTLLGHQGEGTVEVLSHKSWLVDPRHPETAMKLNRLEEGTRTRPVDITVSEAVGRADSLVSYGQARLMTGSEKVRVDTPQEEQALVALLTSGAVLKLSATPERQGMARGTEAKTVYPPNLWFRPSGDFTIERLDSKGLYSQRYISFPWVEQKPPVATVEQVSW